MPAFVRLPEGLRVRSDGTWVIGNAPVAHDRSLFYFKSHLVFEGGGAFVVDGGRRLPIAVEGPAFEVIRLSVEPLRGEARVTLDDGTEEAIADETLGMDAASGQFECAVRGGRARAVLSRAAHQSLLAHAEEEGGRFYLRAGPRRFRIRT
ncbi:MAG TPA: hypothetical protein VFM88_23850 [Vicinamibacteria bacterium]|nr:hypothetical protein [Vicinamibacteria bacterium]